MAVMIAAFITLIQLATAVVVDMVGHVNPPRLNESLCRDNNRHKFNSPIFKIFAPKTVIPPSLNHTACTIKTIATTKVPLHGPRIIPAKVPLTGVLMLLQG